MQKLVRVTTVPISLDKLLTGQLQFMSRYFDVIAVSSDEEYLKNIGEREGVRISEVKMTRVITPIQDLKSIMSLYRLLKKEKPTIIHTHTPKAGMVGMIAGKLAGVPIRLHTVAGLPLMEASGVKRTILNWVEKLTYFFAHKVYPNSFQLLNFIEKEKFAPNHKLKVLASGSTNGINTKYFSRESLDETTINNLLKKLEINEDDFVFIFVGRLVKDKGIKELVSAFHQLSSKNNKIKLLLVGPEEKELDPLDDTTLSLIHQNSNIISVGYQSDVRPYFAISDALVFPSYREGFPNVVMQAGSMDLPSIVSDINGCNEIIIEGKNGLIIPVKDEKAVLEAMRKMIQNPELYTQLKDNARNMIKNRYEQQVVWNAILEEYKYLLQKKG